MQNILRFLANNMKEMEIELRAQSIVLEAVALGIVGVDDLNRALELSRSSAAMLELVESKYSTFDLLVPIADQATARRELGSLIELWDVSTTKH